MISLRNTIALAAASSFAILMAGCGGGSDSGSSVSTITGTLIDSNVSGISYECGDSVNLTDLNGSFTCAEGSYVEFTLGGTTLGGLRVDSAETVQPLLPSAFFGADIIGEGNIGDQRVRNFLRVVQTLDSDHNPDNGITITQAARDALSNTTLNLMYDDIDDAELTTALQNAGFAPVSTLNAMTHYASTLETLGIHPLEEYEYQAWHLQRHGWFDDSAGIDRNAGIGMNDALLKQYDGKGVKIAVIDNGFDVNHEDLAAGILGTYNAQDGTSDVAPDDTTGQYCNHGTAVAGIIGGRANGFGTRGVAPASDLYLIAQSDYYSSSNLIATFNKAEEYGADVISCSWGSSYTTALRDTIHNLAVNGRGGKGVVIVFGAGNDNVSIDVNTTIGSYSDVVTVGATDRYLSKAAYSNYGPAIDVVAPGGYYSGILSPDLSGSDGLADTDEDYNLAYGYMFTGTSAATPVVSGLAALMLQANPNLTSAQVLSILKSTADKIGTESYVDGRNDTFGSGKINAAKALLEAAAL